MNCSLPGSSIHGIFQARVLEWVAIAFSNVLTLRGPFSNSCYQPQAIMFSSLLNREDLPRSITKQNTGMHKKVSQRRAQREWSSDQERPSNSRIWEKAVNHGSGGYWYLVADCSQNLWTFSLGLYSDTRSCKNPGLYSDNRNCKNPGIAKLKPLINW